MKNGQIKIKRNKKYESQVSQGEKGNPIMNQQLPSRGGGGEGERLNNKTAKQKNGSEMISFEKGSDI